jgi:c-di-GMP-binding flagellar brake protein YcgR
MIYCNYTLLTHGQAKEYQIVGKVLSAEELDNRPGVFEHRLEYVNVDEDVREEIIKYIFEEEIKKRRKEQGRK